MPDEKQGQQDTVILANPPFGADRDQEAYPNVREEFSREAETTILFAKLMLDALAPGGRRGHRFRRVPDVGPDQRPDATQDILKGCTVNERRLKELNQAA